MANRDSAVSVKSLSAMVREMALYRLTVARRLITLCVELYKMGRLGFLLELACNKICLSVGEIFTFHVETETITTTHGQLRGRKCVSVFGRPYVRFQGIPYAKPPLGPLRFKDPEPLEPWEGVRDALKEGPISCHFDLVTGGGKGSEDCLYLNIFTPELPSESKSEFKPKAVLFWIHGGGFQVGSGNAEVYSADFLLEEDVILVTINYRLGAFGFLSTGTEDVPGNAGMKDMVMALKWIQKNIAAFGGDPNKVCIFGESAGAAAVQLLMLSPLAKGLFSCAISQSGSATCPWAVTSEAEDTAFALGSKLGFETTDKKQLVDFLRGVPAKTVAKRQTTVIPSSNRRECLPFAFLPTVERPGPNAFLTEKPEILLEKGEYNKVPYITGINEMEAMLNLRQHLDKKPPVSAIDEDFERTVPRYLKVQPGSEKSKEVARRLREFYLGGRKFDKHTYKEFVNLLTDSLWTEPMYRSTNLIIKTSDKPIFHYEFIFDGNFAIFKKLLNVDLEGPTHADDLGYIFYIPILGQRTNCDSPEMRITQRWVRLWCNFAKYHDPTPDPDDPLLKFKWNPVTATDRPYLEITDGMSIKNSLRKRQTDFWDELHRLCGTYN